ncbi:DUF4344 domain-containing metallopeptidase [Roseobacteraceae bacterium S113]
MRILATALCLAATPLAADTETFVESNILAILYHELGHALIDTMDLPVFGQEEDAADVASILLIDQLFEEDAAVQIAYDTAFGFLAEAQASGGEEPAWWDTHGPDLQRYYNTVCLFVGADMDGREDIAIELGLPEERLETCEEEFELAYNSWGAVFEELNEQAPGSTLEYVGGDATLTETTVSAEVAALNEDFVLPEALVIRVDSCGEANAFYDPNDVSITMCAEFEDWLRELAPE